MSNMTIEVKLQEIVEKDRRYDSEAYMFIFEGLDYVSEQRQRRPSKSRHVSILDLLDALRVVALREFGPLARVVLERWGVYRTSDFGEIVRVMIDNNLLNAEEQDLFEDFQEAYSFREVFDEAYRPKIPSDPDELAWGGVEIE